MTRQSILTTLFFVGMSISLFAQDLPATQQTIDVSYGFAQKFNMVRGSYTHYWGLGNKKRWKLGPGVRIWGAFGNDWRMATVNTENNGDGGETQDAIQVTNPSMGAVNLGLFLKYSIGQKIDLGLNFDIIGLGFAANTEVEFTQVSSGERTTLPSVQSPTPNIAFTRGQVSSDNLWVGFNFTEQLQAKIGFNFTGVELEADNIPTAPEDPRFERINVATILGVGYSF